MAPALGRTALQPNSRASFTNKGRRGLAHCDTRLVTRKIAMAMGYSTARHLLQRTGFGGRHLEIERVAQQEVSDVVEDTIAAAGRPAAVENPEWIGASPPTPSELRADREAFQQRRRERALELKEWWFRVMLSTDSPLTERMTLFWHNHFTSSLQKVKRGTLLFEQNALFREHAVGNFADLLRAIVRDPAMLVYLDVHQSERDNPNENFARELMELFTLGEGHYTENDIKEAARAFTGWRFIRRHGALEYSERRHDDGIKTVLGHTGRFAADDIVEILLQEERTAELIVEKLWYHFVSPESTHSRIRELADLFRSSDYELAPVLRAMFTAPEFLNDGNRGSLVKSPVELLVGTSRILNVAHDELRPLVRLARQLGQNIFDPPNVKGWPGGIAWITTNSLLQRQSILRRLCQRPEVVFSVNRTRMGASEAAPLLLAVDPVLPIPEGSGRLATLEHLLLDPAFQLS